MSFLKSAGAVIAGFLTVVVPSMGMDSVMQSIGIFPPISAQGMYATWMLALALVYRIAFTILGGYVTAWLASQNAMKHVWVLAAIGQLGGIIGVIAGWNLSAHWYPISIAVTAIPSVWLGGWLKTRKNSNIASAM